MVNTLERRLIEYETRAAKDCEEIGLLQKNIRDLELQVQACRREIDEAKMNGVELGERTRRECEVVESRSRQSH